MLAVTGRAGGFGVPELVGVADPEVPDVLGLGEVDAEVDARDSAPSDFISAGIASSAAMTTNTAAMTTLGNCIAVLPARTKRVADDPRSFLTQDLVVPISPSIGMRNRLTSAGTCRRWSAQRMMGAMEDGIRVGLLLVATPQLEDPNFRRSVVLLVEHDFDGGTLGVVLNRPTEVPVDRVLPPWAELATGPAVVFQGGPVALENPLALARLPGEDEPLGWRALDGGAEVARVGVVDLEAPPGLLAAELLQLRVFAGYAGWSAGQLRGEIEEGSWYLVPAEAGDVFAADPDRLWQDVLRRQGGDLAFVSTFPEDPTLN
jgi:putative transcriptional regulator